MNEKNFYPLTAEIFEKTEEVSDQAMTYMAEHREEMRKLPREKRHEILAKLYRGEMPTDVDGE